MKRRWVKIAVAAVVTFLGSVALACAVVVVLWTGRAIDTTSATETVRAWGRLAPVPTAATDLKVDVEGNPFTRAFRMSFRAPDAVIDQWLQDSPGTHGVSPRRPAPTVRHYEITPGEGAQHAEVEVDESSGSVLVYVYWS